MRVVSEVFVSVANGDVVTPEPIGTLLPVPMGAVPIGLLTFDELGMGYVAGAEPEEAGDAGLELRGSPPRVLRGTDGVVEPVLGGTGGPVLRGTEGVAVPVLNGTDGETTTLEVAPIAPFEVPLVAGVDGLSRVVELWWGFGA